MSSALGTIASYINQSFLSGIPFHIADRALKESKETNIKWWEDGVNANGKKMMVGSEDGGVSHDDDENSPSGKKRS